MGGNAFKNLELGRVKRADVFPTAQYVVDQLALPGFDYTYAGWAIMGSAGKKEDSGDIDFAMNTHVPQFVGEPDLPVFNKHVVLERCQTVLGKEYVNSSTFRMGNLMTAWPINGDPANGLVQVDFVFGKADWLRFTHFSPSSEDSRFKGVFLQQAMGIWVKMHKDAEVFDETRFEQDGESPLRVGRCGMHMSLELGVFRSWQAEVRRGQGPSKVDADAFETRFPDVPRFSRLGYVNDPQAVLDMFLAPGTTHEQVDTFEKFVNWVRTNRPDRYEEFQERFLFNFSRHKQMGREMSVEELENDPVW